MRDFAARLYMSTAWRRCREAYIKYRGGLCERCLSRGVYNAGVIVHHKIYLTPDNVHDDSIALNFDNLELLCRDCHGAEHSGRRYTVDEYGRVSPRGA